MMMTPLRNPSDPNRAYETGLLRDGNVSAVEGFMEWAGLEGKTLYADYEFLYGRHWRYFKDQEHARAAVELVLSYPEQVQDMSRGRNVSFVGVDELSGVIYRIEIEKKVRGKRNHIRSVFQITPEQYKKIKLEPSRVLQPSQTGSINGVQNARTISSFLRYDTSEKKKVKSDLHKKTNFNGKEKHTMQTTPDTKTPATEEQIKKISYLMEHGCLPRLPERELDMLTFDDAERMITEGKRKSFPSLERNTESATAAAENLLFRLKERFEIQNDGKHFEDLSVFQKLKYLSIKLDSHLTISQQIAWITDQMASCKNPEVSCKLHTYIQELKALPSDWVKYWDNYVKSYWSVEERKQYRDFRLSDAIRKAEKNAELAEQKSIELQFVSEKIPSVLNLKAAAEARTIAAKAREIADDMPTYIDLVTRADKQGDRWAAENAVCAAERNSEYIQELVNGIQETGQKNVSAEKPKIHV